MNERKEERRVLVEDGCFRLVAHLFTEHDGRVIYGPSGVNLQVQLHDDVTKEPFWISAAKLETFSLWHTCQMLAFKLLLGDAEIPDADALLARLGMSERSEENP